MLVKEIVEAVLDEIPKLTDPQEVIRAINRVIGKINTAVYGFRYNENMVTNAAAASGYTWSSPSLTMKTTIKEVLEVWVTDDDDDKTLFTRKPKWYVEQYPTEDVYCMPGRDTLLFAEDNTIFDGSAYDIDVVVNKSFDKIESTDSSIDIPEAWEEAFICGVIARLTLRGDYKDPDIYKDNEATYNQLLPMINSWENVRYAEKGRAGLPTTS